MLADSTTVFGFLHHWMSLALSSLVLMVKEPSSYHVMVTACVEAVDDQDACKGVWPVCEDKVNLILCVTIG